jgi:hypothetical protein
LRRKENVDRFDRCAPSHKRFAFVAGNDGSFHPSTVTSGPSVFRRAVFFTQFSAERFAVRFGRAIKFAASSNPSGA